MAVAQGELAQHLAFRAAVLEGVGVRLCGHEAAAPLGVVVKVEGDPFVDRPLDEDPLEQPVEDEALGQGFQAGKQQGGQGGEAEAVAQGDDQLGRQLSAGGRQLGANARQGRLRLLGRGRCAAVFGPDRLRTEDEQAQHARNDQAGGAAHRRHQKAIDTPKLCRKP